MIVCNTAPKAFHLIEFFYAWFSLIYLKRIFPYDLVINHLIVHNKPLPVYDKGGNVRDWLFVNDHARAIDVIFSFVKKRLIK